MNMPDFALDKAALLKIAGLIGPNFIGDTDAQILQNKTVDSSAQTAAAPAITQSIRSIYQPNIGTRNRWANIFACPGGVLADGPFLNLASYYNTGVSVFYDTTNGNYAQFQRTNGTANLAAGMATPQLVVCKLAQLPNIICKIKTDTTATTRFYFGFTSTGAVPTSTTDTLLANGDSGILIGFRSTDTKYTIFNNSGGGAMTATASAVNLDTTNFHILQICVTATNSVTFLVDGNATTITTNLPASTTFMGWNMYSTTTGTLNAVSLSFAYCNGEANNI